MNVLRRMLALGVMLTVLPSAGITPGTRGGGLVAGGDGVGSLPKTAGQTFNSAEAKFQTVGHVIDAISRQPVPNALVVVTNSQAELVGTALTDADGLFVVYLFADEGLELSIPGEGVVGLPIEAGDLLTIIVP